MEHRCDGGDEAWIPSARGSKQSKKKKKMRKDPMHGFLTHGVLVLGDPNRGGKTNNLILDPMDGFLKDGFLKDGFLKDGFLSHEFFAGDLMESYEGFETDN